MAEIKSLARGLRVLDLLRERDAPLGVTEIAGHLGVNKSSASRLVGTLLAHGYLRRAPRGRGFLAGDKLGRRHDRAETIRDLARPFLFLLMKRSGECAHTAVHAGGHALIVDDVESARSLRAVGGVGRLNGLHCTAVGKCLLAFADLPLPSSLPRRTTRTLTDPDRLARHLDEVRALGYAFDDEENEDGVRCLAAPVLDARGVASACLGISGPAVRVSPQRVPDLAALVVEAARELSQTLGHTPDGAVATAG